MIQEPWYRRSWFWWLFTLPCGRCRCGVKNWVPCWDEYGRLGIICGGCHSRRDA